MCNINNLGMKFFFFSFAVCLFEPFSMFGQDNIISKPVGVIRVVIPTNSETVVSTPFDLLPSADINDVFADQLTAATNEISADAIRVWDSLSLQYTSAYKFKDSTSTNERSKPRY